MVGIVTLLVLAALFVPFALRVHALATCQAVGPSWYFPSRVYSDGVPLAAGRVLPRGYLLAQLQARDYRRTPAPPRRPGSYSLTGRGVEIFLRGFRDGPDPEGAGGPELVALTLDDSLLVSVERRGGFPGTPEPDRDHAPRLEPVLISQFLGKDGVRRSYVTIDRVPRLAQEAVVVAEDRRFYNHMGLDLRGTMRALVANLRAGGVREGGSTISQQLARGLFLSRRRTLSRKLAELPLAVGLELLLPKQKILEMYLNMIYWGQAEGGGVAGIAEAARGYFDTPVESLRVEQASLLAGMIQAPNAIAPFEHPRRALEERNRVLDALAATGKLEPAEASRLKKRPLGLRRGPGPAERFPSYTGYVHDLLKRRFGATATEARGLFIFTTMDLAFQEVAERELAAGIARLEAWSGRRAQPLEGAFVALEPGTELVRALVGGRSSHPGDFNRATQARRQTGSAIKPIVYAAALAEGGVTGFNPASTVPDERRIFGQGEDAWSPRNDGDRYHATATLAGALAHSLNVATANVVEAIGPGTVARYAERFGLGQLKPVLSIGLGTNEVSLLELTDAFAVFPGGGMRRGASAIRFVADGRGRPLFTPANNATQVIPPGIAALMTGLLQDVVSFGVAYPLRHYYGFNRPVAGKTGTTDEYRDAWFIGFTPYLVAGLWIGYDTPRSLGRPATHVALPLWASMMDRLVGDFPLSPFASDQGLEYHYIDPWTGYLADMGGCPMLRAPFLPGTSPTVPCSAAPDTFHYEEDLDSLYMGDTTGVPGQVPEEPMNESQGDTTVIEGPGSSEDEP